MGKDWEICEMKQSLNVFASCFGLILCFCQCSPTLFRNYHGECIGIDNEGNVQLRINNSEKKYSLIQEEKEAIHFLLFSGFVGGENCQTQPPILKNEQEIKLFKEIENQFFKKNGDWNRFVKSNSIKNRSQNIVFVSREQLINYLQEKLIIKSLNSGF